MPSVLCVEEPVNSTFARGRTCQCHSCTHSNERRLASEPDSISQRELEKKAGFWLGGASGVAYR